MRKEQNKKSIREYENDKHNYGITLVALVITIIIIIILSTVTISYVLGDGGLIDQAKLSRNLVQESIENESRDLNKLAQEYKDLFEDGEDNNYYLEETEDGKTVPVPKGFVISKATGERKVSDGLVIYEGTEDVVDSNVQEARKNRDQFVWIPTDGNSYLESDDNDLYDIDSLIEKENKEIGESIKKYGGFYISRYEIANDGNKYVSKQGYSPNTNITLQEAINNSRSMYAEDNTNYGASSTLIYGKQWDIFTDSLTGKYDLQDSSSYGNYYNFNRSNINIAKRNYYNSIIMKLADYNYQIKLRIQSRYISNRK